MTDEEPDAKPRSNDELAANYLEPDRILMTLVGAVNFFDMELNITLHVSGVTVSGILIPADRFFEQAAEAAKQAGTGPVPAGGALVATEFLIPWFESIAKDYRDQAEKERAKNPDDKGAPPPIHYIHLRDAAIHASGGNPLPRTLWRGRLSHVSGWSLGEAVNFWHYLGSDKPDSSPAEVSAEEAPHLATKDR